jgi:hypothetical protein
MKKQVKVVAFFLLSNLILSTFGLTAKRALRRDAAAPAVKEYVVVASEKDSVIAKLGELFDRLKLFADQPKGLKDLQDQTNQLEDSLRKNIAQIKDCHYVISRIKTETAKMKNDIPTQQNNLKAKEVFDKIVDYWNNAEGELEKISNFAKDFDSISDQITAKTKEIAKVLESGDQEINAIKDELDKIASIQEQFAGKEERGLSRKINQTFGAKKVNASNPQTKDQTPPAKEKISLVPSSQNPPTSKKIEDQPPTATLSATESLNVLASIIIRFVKVAYVGAKDIFTRLFLAESTVSPKVDIAAEKAASGPDKTTATTPDSINPDKTAPGKPPTGSTPPSAQQYKQAAIESLTSLKNAVIGLAANGLAYLKELYSKVAVLPESPLAEPGSSSRSIAPTSEPTASVNGGAAAAAADLAKAAIPQTLSSEQKPEDKTPNDKKPASDNNTTQAKPTIPLTPTPPATDAKDAKPDEAKDPSSASKPDASIPPPQLATSPTPPIPNDKPADKASDKPSASDKPAPLKISLKKK